MLTIEQLCSELCCMNIQYREKIDVQNNIKFGTEIEFENACYLDVSLMIQNKKKLSNWHLKGDATVNTYYEGKTYGGELTSPILHDTKQSWGQLKTACKLLRRNLALIQGRSGAHIHIDSGILKDDENLILNLVKLWMAYEHIIYRFSYGDEDKPRKMVKRYASPLAPFYNIFLTAYSINPNNYDYMLTNIKLNKSNKLYYLLSNIYDFGAIRGGICFNHCKGISDDELNTIEIRCPNGTLNHITWQNNINFFTKLFMYCASPNFDKEFIDNKNVMYEYKNLEQYSEIYFSDAIELADLIFDNELDKMYFLKQYLKINQNNFEIVKEKALKR